MISTIAENLLSKADLLIVFGGMFLLVWRALSIAHDLSRLALQKAPEPVPAPPAPAAPHQPSPQSTVPVPAPAAATDGPVVDDGLVAFVKKEEGFSAKAYPDNRQWSIGYGTKADSHSEVITEAEADKRLRAELADAYASVEKFIPNAPKGVKQAMTDATYNLGPKWQTQGLGTLLAQGKYEEAKPVLAKYCHEIHEDGTVETLQDLVNRRNKEIAMFDSPL